MLGEDATETVEDLILPAARTELLTADPVSDFVATLDRPGPTIMMFGDSFTQDYFARMVAAARRASGMARVPQMRLRLESNRPVSPR